MNTLTDAERVRIYRQKFGFLPSENRALDEAYAQEAVERKARERICDSLEEALAANGSGQFMAMVKVRKALEAKHGKYYLG